jgi:hypothetical protein
MLKLKLSYSAVQTTFRADFRLNVIVFFLGMATTNVFSQDTITIDSEPSMALLENEAAAEEIVIIGTVRDANKEPVPFVHIMVDGESLLTGTRTDIEGNYEIKIDQVYAKTKLNLTVYFMGLMKNSMEIQNIRIGKRIVDFDLLDLVLNEEFCRCGPTVVIKTDKLISRDPSKFNTTVIEGEDLRNY